MLLEFGTHVGNGFDVVSSYDLDTKVWTTQVYDTHQRPIGDPVLSYTEEGVRFDHNQIAKAFNNVSISGYVRHKPVGGSYAQV